jgi:hypothetical protein
MGTMFTSNQGKAYVPPIGGSANSGGGQPSVPTLLAGRTSDQPAQPPTITMLPNDMPGTWSIELREFPVLNRGHAFLSLVGPDGEVKGELHGRSYSRNTGQPVAIGMDGSALKSWTPDHKSSIGAGSSKIATVAADPYDDIVRDAWSRGLQAANNINNRNFDYKADDGSYELGLSRSGGQIQNSNSAAYTFGRAMGLDLDSAVRSAGAQRSLPGWGRNLLDPGYKPYVAPPQFPFNAP